MKAKAQGSLEFLMTYGWAIVIILIVGVVAWRWGLFSFSGVVKPGQYGFWGVSPVDYKMAGNGQLTLSLLNSVGANVTVNYIKAIGGSSNITTSSIGVIENGKRKIISITSLPSGVKGDRFDVFLIINYTDSRMSEGKERLSSGVMWGSFE